MYKKTLQSVKNPLTTEVDSVNARKPHFIFSAENPRYPVKYNLDHQGVQDLLTKKGYRFDVIQGHYGSPENSILVHNPNKHAVRYLQKLAEGLGQESSIYSDGYNHEMHFHHGEHAGQHLKGQGTNFHKRPPEDYFSTLKDGTTFTHSFDMENFHEPEMSKLKPEGYVKKSEDELTLIHYSPTQGLKSINPIHQGNRIKDSSSKYGRPEHPVSFFYRQDSPTEDLVTQGSNSKYHVKTQEAKLYDLGLDKDKVSQHLKQSGQTLNPGIVTRDELHGELKKRGFHGFYNSQHEREDMRGVVGLYHETPVESEESLNNIQKGIQSPSKHIGLDRLKQIKSDNHIGAGGKEYSEEEVGHAINERQTNVANKMVAGASKQEKIRAQNEENAAKGIGGALPTDFPWMNKPKPTDKGSDKIRGVADRYAASKGMRLQHKMPAVKVDPTRAKRIADAYHQANHEPQAQHVQQAYQALVKETNDQFKHILNSGLKISKIKPGQENPYKTSKDLFHDIHNNNHIWYFPTESGYGSDPNQADSAHPMLQPTEHMHEGQPMVANDVFRIVHDYFGHAKEGHGFGAEGEENAWKNHMQMYSPMAQKALTAETRGQNSWVNFGPHGENNRKNPANTIYADQKATVLPDWAMDSEHNSIYKQLGGLKKREIIMMKGAKQRLFPFNPNADITDQNHNNTKQWVNASSFNRDNVPSVVGNARQRALLNLYKKTQTRKNPNSGELEVLLHRGMHPIEHHNTIENNNHTYDKTSWTPNYNTAHNFAQDYFRNAMENPNDIQEQESTYGKKIDMSGPKTMSSWIPVKHIHSIPMFSIKNQNQQDHSLRENLKNEHEVIVNPHKLNTHQPEKNTTKNSVQSVYSQMQLKKREIIMMKGAMNRLAPFNPDKNLNPEDHKATENWTKEGDDQDARQNVPEIHANAKIRALHKLTGKTQVRRHPKTGERMFLLHRGMAESEFQTNHINGVANYPPNSFTSWTPSYKVASGFASDHLENLGKSPRVVSAWIPESHIHNVPNATLIPDENTQFRTEHEVIVNHKGKIAHANPKIVELAKEPRKDLNQKINLTAQAKASEKELPNAWQDDHKRMVQRQQRAEEFKRKKFGKREAIVLQPLQKGDISNKIKSGIAGLAIAAGTMAPMDTSKQTQVPQPTQPKVVENKPTTPTKKDRVLSGIKFIESSNGKNTDHAEMKSGLFKGDKAYGSYGLMPVVIRETIKRIPNLMQAHSAALGLTGQEFHDYMDKNPKLEHLIASKHYDHIVKALGENPMHIGYAWLNGIAGTKKAIKNGRQFKDHHYVQKLMNQLHPPVKNIKKQEK
ncbi:MAG TPA: hypothetical protein DDY18_06910 [Flavobacterium sp.]|jgi:hypothetical protein|nr:hypothetical protein [Flavobacterium sp.]